MKGYESILQIAGYKEDSSMEEVLEPDKGKLSVLAAELLMAKLEVEQMNNAGSAVQQKQKVATIHHNQTVSHFTSSVTGTIIILIIICKLILPVFIIIIYIAITIQMVPLFKFQALK